MNKPRTIEGQWSIFGDDKPAHFGVLTFDPEDGLNLSVKIPRSSTVEEIILGSLKERPKLPKVIHGIDHNDKPVTLFGCAFPRTGKSQGLERYDIRSMAALIGCRADSWHEAKFVTAGAEFSLFHNWMGRDPLRSVTSTEGKPAITIELLPKILFDLKPGVRVRVESTLEMTHDVDRMEYRFGHRLWFHFTEPRSVSEIHDSYIGVFLRLLCLLTGERVFADCIQFANGHWFVGGERPTIECQFLQSCSGISEAKRDKHPMVTAYAEIENQFPDVVRRWFECDLRFAPVLDLFLNVKANPMAIQTRFLLLAQAVEAYHSHSERFAGTELPKELHKKRLEAVVNSVPAELKDWVKERLASSNQKRLAMRLDDLLKTDAQEISKLTAAIPNFADKVKHTRNYYTHYSSELLEAGKVARGTELIRLGFALQEILEICLLKEIGIAGKPIDGIVLRASGRQYYTLAEDPPPASGGVGDTVEAKANSSDNVCPQT